MTDREVTKTRPSVSVPLLGGGLGIMYNLRSVPGLRLSGETLARIFGGGITAWDAPAIATDNLGMSLPAQPITVVVRSDGAATSLQRRIPGRSAAELVGRVRAARGRERHRRCCSTPHSGAVPYPADRPLRTSPLRSCPARSPSR
ncbi:substrate-binding domain-containing protein [Actinocrispum sp. NPDC049592]|uniref:substrate-binding domain-containing protein n=1 Tax=Actinocrispum sp. NPDC049592 TaxID=3154835 RepID=UPI00341B9D44